MAVQLLFCFLKTEFQVARPLAGTNYNHRYWTINLKRLTECSVIVWNYRPHWDFHKDWLGFFMRNNEKEQIKTAAGSLEPSRSQLLSSHANLWPFKMHSCWAIYRSKMIENLCRLIIINFVCTVTSKQSGMIQSRIQLSIKWQNHSSKYSPITSSILNLTDARRCSNNSFPQQMIEVG